MKNEDFLCIIDAVVFLREKEVLRSEKTVVN
mgnify:CR=1 FL=1